MSFKKLVGFTTLLLLVVYAFFSAQNSSAQSLVNGPGNVGPELAYFDRGNQEDINRNVLVPNGFTGAVQVINNIYEEPYNPAPGTNATLRLVEIKPWTTIEEMVSFAQKLNNFNGFPEGTIVIVGNELNNLTKEYPVFEATFNNESDLRAAAQKYGEQYVAFARAINHSKYRVAPAPPDLYNANWDPVPWVDAFASYLSANGGCSGATDTLIANVFDVPSRVGLPNLETHQYLTRICGLSVQRFGGWGAWPGSSIAEQVEFYNNTPLPEGVTQATTLIANNCGGSRGDLADKWLFYIDGKVYEIDGSLVDPENCATSSFEYQKVDCAAESDPEFHSLRPYPANPCNPNAEQLAIMCGNDLVAKETFEVDPTDAVSCSAEPYTSTGPFTCQFKIESSMTLGLNLDAAELPIMGNTELVPNSTTATSSLNYPQRVNEYVSWYLNGTTSRAEEEDELVDIPKAEWGGRPLKVVDPEKAAERISEVINLSGPLKKLLPLNVQNGLYGNLGPVPVLIYGGLRTKQQEDAATRVIRHNQIAVCTADITRQYPSICYNSQNAYKSRLTDIPAVIDINMLLRTYRLNPLYSFIPFSSTEDRVGYAVGSDVSGVEYQGVRITESVFQSNETTRNLFFAHMEENSQLASALQGTFVPYGQPTSASPLSDVAPAEYSDFGACVALETRSNPGDDLYAELADNPEQIGGNLDYTAEFECEFPPRSEWPIDETLYNACVAGRAQTCQFCAGPDQCFTMGGTLTPDPNCAPGYCCNNIPGTTPVRDPFCEEQARTLPKCTRSAVNVMNVQIATPLADEIWSRLVAGGMSVFRRIFPKTGVDQPVDRIKDIPGETRASYTSTNITSTIPLISQQTQAGAIDGGVPGSSAKVYIPHLGGVYDYFLKNIQCALRPAGMGCNKDVTGVSDTTTPQPGYPSGLCSPDNLRPYFGNLPAGDYTETMSCVCSKESAGGNPFAFNDNCLTGTLPKDRDFSVGLFQLNLLVQPNYSQVPDGLRQKFIEAGVPNAESASCHDAFGDTYEEKIALPCKVRPGYETMIEICKEWYFDPVHNIEQAVAILGPTGGGLGLWSTANSCPRP